MRPRLLAASLTLLAVTATACGGDDTDVATSTAGATSSPTAPATAAAPSPTATSTPSAGAADAAEGEFSLSPSTAEVAGGGGLTVVDVRVAQNEGFDRVVFELEGEGTAGWSVQYEDDPRTPGEGAPVELEGDAVLAVLLEGVGYPFDTGIEEYSGPKEQSPGLSSIRALRLGGVYEGYYDAFVGVAERRPFRVFRLDGPQRVVVDVAYGD